MDILERKSHRHILLYCIQLIGLVSIFVSLKQLQSVSTGEIYFNLAVTAFFFLIFSPWVVTLPSDASWRPGMAFILFSILNFDYKLVILVAIPGIIFISWRKRDFFSSFFLSIGHLTIGIYAAGIVKELIRIKFDASLLSYLAIIICLFAHFLGNRLIAALIVAIHKQRSFLKQVKLIKNDLNWGYSCAYILGILMYLVFIVYNVPGLLMVIVLLITIYQALSYYIKLKDIEEKIYLDGLTEAENRMSWEKLIKDTNYVYQSGMVFMMDLDYFKMINDNFGHSFGDRILQEFASHIKREITREYRFFRYGGDEFILVVYAPEMEYDDVSMEVNKILNNQNEIWNKVGLTVSVSYGAARISKQESMEYLIRKADKSMYKNKSNKNTLRNAQS